MEKLDMIKTYKACYTATSKPALVDIGPARYLSIMGIGDPSGTVFPEKIRALYATAYTIKFMFKALEQDFAVPKLEAQWWFDEERLGRHTIMDTPGKVARAEWEYRLLIRLPDYIGQKAVSDAVMTVIEKKKISEAASVKLFEMTEGLCVQVMHEGPFDKEPETLQRIEAFVQENNLLQNGLHHEIYLSDFNRTSPHKLRTILREPVRR